MRTKALITGARPEPYEGPWVPLEGAESWRTTTLCEPEVRLTDEIVLEVRLSTGNIVTLPLRREEIIAGSMVRAIIQRAIGGTKYVSVGLEEVR